MMYPGPFKAAPIGFHYPGHQPAPPFYQNLYAGYNAQFQPYHENSPLTSARPHPLLNDHYGLAQARQSGQHALPGLPQYPPPPSVPFQHHELKGKKNDKRTDLSPTVVAEKILYSDGEKTSESYSGSQFLALKSPSKREDLNHHDLQQLSHGSKNNKDENCQGGEERKHSIKIGKRQSRSKLPRQRPHRSTQHQKIDQADLPEEIKAQVQAIQNGYKQAKRPSRLPHEESHPAAANHLDQLQSNMYPPYHPYQSHVPHPDYFTSITPYNAFQARANITGSKNPLEREIHRLRQHIHTLETELHKLQKKVNRSAVSHHRPSNKTDHNSKPKRSKRNGNASPRQTPCIVEMTNSTAGTLRDLPHKKHHHRTRTHGNSRHDKKTIQQSAKIYEENSKSSNLKARSPSPKEEEEEINPCDCLHSSGSHALDSETKHSSSSTQQLRDETAAQLAYAVEARINARPQVPSGQYQFVYQQETSPTQTQQMRESHNSHLQQRTTTDSNYNYSNNNNDIITNSEERYNRSAEKILDAFERFYRNIGKTPAVPMKVKYIPEDNNSNHFPHRHMQNHNQYPSMSRGSESPLSVRSNSERVTAQGVKVKTIYSYN